MRRPLPPLLWAAVAVLAVTSVGFGKRKADLEIMQRDLKAHGERLAALEQQNQQLLQALAQLREQTSVPSLKNQADLEETIDRLDREVTQLAEQLRDVMVRLSRLTQQVTVLAQQPPPDTGEAPDPPQTAPTDPPPAVSTPEELYQTAYTDYTRGDYQLALLGFQDFLERYPQSELADNAQYWIGECHYSNKSYEAAISAFDQVLTRYPNGDKTPAAHLKKGFALLETNQTAQGVIQLQYLIQHFPDRNEAYIARQRLRALGLGR